MTRTTIRGGTAMAAALLCAPVLAEAQSIDFWAQTYGDNVAWARLLDDLAAEFEAETGTAVNIETVSWPNAFQTWLTVANGGAAPDCGDMYWLHSFSGIGGEAAGPLPITEHRDRWSDLEEQYYAGSLEDVFWDGEFYGIPWRGDIRPMMVRTDMLAEAGLDGPPETWEEIAQAAEALTVRDANGNVERWGFAFGGAPNAVSAMIPYYWQAGGEFMTDDGRTATIDNQAMRDTLQWMHDMVWVHEAASPEFMEKTFDLQGDFISGRVAIMGSTGVSWANEFSRNYPEIEGKWALAVSAAGPEDRDTFAGAGYFGVLRGSDAVEECVDWIAFLSRPENMQRLSETSGNVSPMRAVMASDFWSDAEWKRMASVALEDAHTSQMPSPVWSAIANPEPGGVLYDLVYEAVVERGDIDAAVTRAQERMQAELDRAG